MNCSRIQDRLLLYLAGELEPEEIAKLCRHMENCARCTAAAEELAVMQDLVDGALATTVSAPLTLHARVMAAVRREPARPIPMRRSSSAVFWVPGRCRRPLAVGAAALSLLIGGTISGYFAGHWHADRNASGVSAPERPTLTLSLLGNDHLKYLANPQPAQVPGPDPAQVSRGLTPLLQFPVAVVDLHSEGARLLGGRKCQAHGVPIAFLLYDWKGERVSLYQIDGRKLALPTLRGVVLTGRRFQVGKADGLSYITWRSGAMHFVMVSGAEPEHLLRLARCASGYGVGSA